MAGLGTQLRKIRKERAYTQSDLASKLGLAQTTIANYEQGIRFPDEETLNKMADLLGVSIDALMGREVPVAQAGSAHGPNGSEADRVLRLLLDNDYDAAEAYLQGLLKNELTLSDIYVYILQRVLYQVGQLWQQGTIDVYEEHAVSAHIRRLMHGLSSSLSANLDGPRFVACTFQGEHHELGILMISDLLRIDGWNTLYLGANVPTRNIIQSIEGFDPKLLGISVTIPRSESELRNDLEALRAAPKGRNLKILLGGAALKGGLGESLSDLVDAVAEDAAQARNLAQRFA